MTEQEIILIKHCVLGSQPRIIRSSDDVRPGFYRNRFVTGEGTGDYNLCEGFVEQGIMAVRKDIEMFGGSNMYWLTEEGLDVADELFPIAGVSVGYSPND